METLITDHGTDTGTASADPTGPVQPVGSVEPGERFEDVQTDEEELIAEEADYADAG